MGSGSSRGERSERGEPLGPGGMTPQQLYYLQHSLYGGAPLGERGFLPQAGLTPEQLSMIASQGGALGDVFFPFPPEQVSDRGSGGRTAPGASGFAQRPSRPRCPRCPCSFMQSVMLARRLADGVAALTAESASVVSARRAPRCSRDRHRPR